MTVVIAVHAGVVIAGPGQGSHEGAAISVASPPHPVLNLADHAHDTQPMVSSEVAYVDGWVGRTNDNAGMPYIIIDKVNAKVFVFDVRGKLQGQAPALLGLEQGDGSAKGLGNLKLSAIRPMQRTTPAGRYMASLGRDLHGGDILWIDYANGIALHRVVKGTPAEHRAQRLDSETSEDNRISFGCINVPVTFYEGIVSPAFANSNGVVYILPEMSSARDMFKSPPTIEAGTHITPAPAGDTPGRP